VQLVFGLPIVQVSALLVVAAARRKNCRVLPAPGVAPRSQVIFQNVMAVGAMNVFTFVSVALAAPEEFRKKSLPRRRRHRPLARGRSRHCQ
jgi:hypothetical protein